MLLFFHKDFLCLCFGGETHSLFGGERVLHFCKAVAHKRDIREAFRNKAFSKHGENVMKGSRRGEAPINVSSEILKSKRIRILSRNMELELKHEIQTANSEGEMT